MTNEQKDRFETLIDSMHYAKGGVFFLYGYDGVGKTYIWRSLTSFVMIRG